MKVLVPAMLLLAMTACGYDKSDEGERDETVGTEIARDYNNAMDKARNVENLTFENKDRLDGTLEAAEGQDPR